MIDWGRSPIELGYFVFDIAQLWKSLVKGPIDSSSERGIISFYEIGMAGSFDQLKSFSFYKD